MLPKALKSITKSNKSPNLVTLVGRLRIPKAKRVVVHVNGSRIGSKESRFNVGEISIECCNSSSHFPSPFLCAATKKTLNFLDTVSELIAAHLKLIRDSNEDAHVNANIDDASDDDDDSVTVFAFVFVVELMEPIFEFERK